MVATSATASSWSAGGFNLLLLTIAISIFLFLGGCDCSLARYEPGLFFGPAGRYKLKARSRDRHQSQPLAHPAQSHPNPQAKIKMVSEGLQVVLPNTTNIDIYKLKKIFFLIFLKIFCAL